MIQFRTNRENVGLGFDPHRPYQKFPVYNAIEVFEIAGVPIGTDWDFFRRSLRRIEIVSIAFFWSSPMTWP
jgi:hypothetical protein